MEEVIKVLEREINKERRWMQDFERIKVWKRKGKIKRIDKKIDEAAAKIFAYEKAINIIKEKTYEEKEDTE